MRVGIVDIQRRVSALDGDLGPQECCFRPTVVSETED